MLGVSLQLQDILCGVSLAELKPELKLELGAELRSELRSELRPELRSEAPPVAPAASATRKSPAKPLPSSPTDPP